MTSNSVNKPARLASWLALCCCTVFSLISTNSHAEQVHRFAGHEVHYIVIPTTFLEADVASQYNVTRAKNRALVNIAVLDSENSAVTAALSGDSSNLLGQTQELNFRKVQEGDAIYYLAELLHSDEDVQRLNIQVQLANGRQDQIKFNQKMYWTH